MRISRKIFVIVLVLFPGFLCQPLSGIAKDVVNVGLRTAPFGTGSYVLGSALEELSKKNHPWLRISHTESPGLVYNIKKMEKDDNFKKTTIISSADSMLWLARKGMKPLKEKMGNDVRILAIYNLSAIWFGTLDSDIKTIADFSGKKVALGKKTQIGWGILANWYLDLGWDLEGKIKYQWVGNKPALRAILDGLVDAVPIGGYMNPITYKMILTPHTRELIASGKNVYHLTIGEKAILKVREKKPGFPSPIAKIPPGTIKGWDKEIETALSAVVWAVSEKFPGELAYETVKLLIDHCGAFKNYHALGKLMSPESLCFGLTPKELHPDAYRAYKDAGLLK